MRKCALILARFQPIHFGHLELIDTAVKTYNEILILVGSADKNNLRNPIPIEFRLSLIKDALKEKYKDNNNIVIRVATVDNPYIDDKELKSLPEGTKIIKVVPLDDHIMILIGGGIFMQMRLNILIHRILQCIIVTGLNLL